MMSRTKKFIAPTLRQALDAMRQELGEDALLLATNSGIDSNGSPYAEVVGMSTGVRSDHSSTIATAAGAPTFPRTRPTQHQAEPVPLRYYLEQSPHPTSDSTILALQEEIHQLSAKLTALTHAVAYRYSAILPDPYRTMYQLLRDAGFSDHHAGYLISRIAGDQPAYDLDECIQRLHSILVELLPTRRFIVEGPPTLIAFAGPSGSGKTTTLMKAAILLHRAYPEKTMRLVTADTERIAAVEQIRSFSALVQMPLEIIRTRDHVANLPARAPESITLVDLPPPSQRTSPLSEMLIDVVVRSNGLVVLTLPASCDTEIAKTLLQRASGNASFRIALTKLDESPRCGHLLPLFWELRIPLSLLTTGTQLPDDITEPSVDHLLRFLVPTQHRTMFTTA